METKWVLLEKKSKSTPLKFSVDYNILNILSSRGIKKENEILDFLFPNLDNLEDPLRLKGVDIASEYILKAIKEDKKICIYGDYDVDGITSTSLLYLTLKDLGCNNLMYYIPLRNEGYGLNTKAIDELKSLNVDLIITVDCGISSYNEVEYINSLGMKVIVTDHHDIPNYKLPRAITCINPKIIDSEYSFSNLAGVGVAFMLAYNLYKLEGDFKKVYNYLDLVALGTIADIMPLISQNRILVKYGLEKIMNTDNLGLKTILERLDLYGKELSVGNVGFKITPIFNATGRLSDAKLGVKLLISDNPMEIKSLADNLISNNIDRKKLQDKIIEIVLKKLKNEGTEDKSILIDSNPDYHHGVLGIVASKILEEYNKPTIIMEENLSEGIAIGSCRSIEGFNINKALSSVSHLLVKFGGHEQAAGFTIKLENIEKFKEEIENYTKETLKNIKLVKKINIDMKIPVQKISYEFIQTLNLLKPYGTKNPKPNLVTKNCIISNVRTIGKDNNHIQFDIDQKGFSIKNVTWFNKPDKVLELKKDNIFYDIVFNLEISEYKDKYYTNVYIVDMKPSNLEDDALSYFNSVYNTTFPIKSVFYTNYDIDKNSKIYLKRIFENFSIVIGQKTIARLDKNISILLSQLKDFYNYEFELKIENIERRENHNIVNIIIKRKYYLENYSNSENVQYRNIKKFIRPNFEYNSITQEILSKFLKENQSILISENNINIYMEDKKVKLDYKYFEDVFVNIGLKYIYDNKKKMIFYTNNRFFTLNPKLRTYFEFRSFVNNEEHDICIFDFNTLTLPKFKIKYKKALILYNKDYTNDKIYVIKKDIVLPKNIIKFNKNNIIDTNSNEFFFKFLPDNIKKEKLDMIKEGKIIYSDESIVRYF